VQLYESQDNALAPLFEENEKLKAMVGLRLLGR
jgi:hypothetical protein